MDTADQDTLNAENAEDSRRMPMRLQILAANLCIHP